MYSLNVIRKINAPGAKAPAPESTHSRHCSYAGDPETGIVLHSAKRRSTAFIASAAARRFLASWLGTNCVDARDELVESYFSAVPTGKQVLVA